MPQYILLNRCHSILNASVRPNLFLRPTCISSIHLRKLGKVQIVSYGIRRPKPKHSVEARNVPPSSPASTERGVSLANAEGGKRARKGLGLAAILRGSRVASHDSSSDRIRLLFACGQRQLLASMSQGSTRPRPTVYTAKQLEIMCASPKIANASMLPATFARVRLNLCFIPYWYVKIQVLRKRLGTCRSNYSMNRTGS